MESIGARMSARSLDECKNVKRPSKTTRRQGDSKDISKFWD
jgi:hypothetical protein